MKQCWIHKKGDNQLVMNGLIREQERSDTLNQSGKWCEREKTNCETVVMISMLVVYSEKGGWRQAV